MSDPPFGAGQSEPDFPLPESVGAYRLLREIGRGGMGRVFLAEQETPDFRRQVALKIIGRPGHEVESVRRFRDEVRILAALDHPNIVRFLDGGKSPEEIWFLALEYVEGDDLLAHARKRALGVEERVRLVLAVAEAVAFAHGRGVVHRDIKPTNVLIGRDGRPRLLDFGISKLLDPAEPANRPTTRSGVRPLTPAYASPEQLGGEPATAASDLYSLGVVLYELLTGERPRIASGSTARLEPPSVAARRRARASGEDPSGGGRLRLDRDLDAICRQALALAPGERYASADAFAADLRSYLESRPVTAPGGRGGRLSARAARALAARPVRGALAGLLLAAGLVAAVVAIRRESAAPPSASRTASANRFPFDPSNPPSAADAERRWAAEPGDRAAGAALVAALLEENRLEEARLAFRRLEQLPGAAGDPLTDFAAAMIAFVGEETQRALVLYSRALDKALAQKRTDLVPTIRVLRGAMLLRLGPRDAARQELTTASAELERAGDLPTLHRALNLLALEDARRGETEKSRASYERAMDAARRGGFPGLMTLGNFADLDRTTGRPDLAEMKLRQVVEARKREGNAAREGLATLSLALAVRDLGRAAESVELLDRAIALLSVDGYERSLGLALTERAVGDLEGARLDRYESIVGELERLTQAALHRRALGYARQVRARGAALRGDLAAARRDFAEARRLLRADGDFDLAANSDVAWAEAELAAGELESAARVLGEALAELAAPGSTEAGYFAALLLARIEARSGRPAEAARRLAALAEGERSPSHRRRLAFLSARADLAAHERKVGAARADREAAIALARALGYRTRELALRLELARLGGDRAAATAVAREAEALGLVALAREAGR